MKVAIAILCDAQQRILITQRAATLSEGGLWEFPGGKLEAEETPQKALIREVQEEVGLQVIDSKLVLQINEALRSFFVFLVSQYQGDARCCETQQDLRWVRADALETFSFPMANQPIIRWIQQHLLREALL